MKKLSIMISVALIFIVFESSTIAYSQDNDKSELDIIYLDYINKKVSRHYSFKLDDHLLNQMGEDGAKAVTYLLEIEGDVPKLVEIRGSFL